MDTHARRTPAHVTAAAIICVTGMLGCGAMEPGEADNATESQSSALSSNVAYLPGQTLQAKGGTDPGAAVFLGKAIFSFIRTDGHVGIIVENNLGSGQNATSYALTDSSNYAASLAVFNGTLFMFYVGTDSNLWMRRSSDATNWDGPFNVAGGPFEYAPCATTVAGGLSVFVAFNAGPWNRLYQMDISGTSASANTSFPLEFTNDTPTATNWNGTTYVSWAGTDSNKPIYLMHRAASGWTTPTIVSGNFGHPSLFALSSSKLELVYRGNNQHIFHTVSTDGVSFGSVTQDSASTTDHTPIPFLASGSSAAWTFYVGVNNHLYTVVE